MVRRWRRFLTDTSGAAALEFALIALPLMLFTFGITEFGRAVFMRHSLLDATDFAARRLYINPDAPVSTIRADILDRTFLIDPSRLTVVRGQTSPQGGTTGFRTVTLTVNYEFVSLVPKLITSAVAFRVERTVVLDR
jgi:Flp pilus assembly protein TadG